MQKIKQHIFLLLALLSLGAALFSFFILEKGAIGASEEKYLSTIKTRVQNELGLSQRESIQILDIVSKNLNLPFSKLTYPTKYPYYIFKNDSLVYWSDYRFVPSFSKIKEITQPQVVDFDKSLYIVSRKQYRHLVDTIDVFSLVNLYQYYKNENTYLQSSYNPDLFSIDPQGLSLTIGMSHRNVIDDQNRLLFSIIPPRSETFHNENTPVNTVIWGSLMVLFLGIYVFQWIVRLSRKRYIEYAFLILAIYLIALRAGMLFFGIPFLISDSDLFNSKYYASSIISPSLGDLLLNCLVVFILTLYIVNFLFKSKGYYFLVSSKLTVLQKLVSLLIAIFSYWIFYLAFSELKNIYEESQFTLDITLSVSFSQLKVASLVIFVIISSIYFLITHILVSLFTRFNPNYKFGVLLFVLATIIALGLGKLFLSYLDWIVAVHSIYFLGLYFYRFPRSLYTFRYRTTIYYFTGAFFCAIITAYVVATEENKKDVAIKKDYGKQIIAENDGFGEFLLDRANESIRKDSYITETFASDTVLARERIQQKIKSIHLDKFFDKYDIEVLPFKANGKPLDNSSTNFETYIKPFRIAKFKTDYANIYFINDLVNDFKKQYISIIDIKKDSILIGHVILNLNPRTNQPTNVYPELLKDKKFTQASETRQYSYAIYDNQKRLVYSIGSYNYDRKLPMQELNNTQLFENGKVLFGYKHVGSKDKNGRLVLVSSKYSTIGNLLSNFSFLYLILVLYVIFIVMLFAFRFRYSYFKISFASKIQILLNIAFFAPLILLVFIILSVISTNYYTSQENSYLQSTRNISNNFVPYLEEYLKGARSKESLDQELNKIARDAKVDANFFDEKGKLVATTQPLIYESNLLSNYLNPSAYVNLVLDRENEVLLNESLGTQQYRTAYVTMRTNSSSKLLGVLSVPYVDSKPELDHQIIELISTILRVFAIMFIFFLALSFWASKLLTVPLQMMTRKFKRINLYKLNEPVEWKSEDEIGLLVDSYNEMLHKLEESKQELAKNEKQTAWREMAKQVAHEIKNPLTPMKLTIQQLQRTLLRDMPHSERIKRTFETLIDQIDNISDIATSFSDFAKMPLPKNEIFEITSVLNKAADLYADDGKVTLYRNISKDKVNVVGDRQLLGRIITNLIINGIQSVPPERRPEINLRLHTDESNVYIEVKDNGRGIPESIGSKVFLPNFSTKQGGSGLGLAIAKRGVEHAGGTIWFETEEYQGTTFFLSLPIAHIKE